MAVAVIGVERIGVNGMTDLAQRLRDGADEMSQFVNWRNLLREAADAIDALTAERDANERDYHLACDARDRAEARLAAAEARVRELEQNEKEV